MATMSDMLWSLRDGETLELFNDEPADGLWFAARIVPVPLPGTPVAPYRGEPNQSVEQCAVVAAHRNSLGEWQWLHLSPGTKGHVVNFMVDVGEVARDRWYYVVVGRDKAMAAEVALADRKRARNSPQTCIKCGVGAIVDSKCTQCDQAYPKLGYVTVIARLLR
jgi:hypothetical protein